jgi:prevent-host-death family protein
MRPARRPRGIIPVIGKFRRENFQRLEAMAAEISSEWKARLNIAGRSGYVGQMKTANVSEAKNNLSALLRRVKRGETITIYERKRPVAQLAPIDPASQTEDEWIADLERRGILSRPKERMNVKEFLKLPLIKLPRGVSAVQAIIEDREDRV